MTEWIKCTDKMPNENKEYIILRDTGEAILMPMIVMFNNNYWPMDKGFFCFGNGHPILCAKYWMEIPKLPEDA